MSNLDADVAEPHLLPLQIAHQSEYVIGFPMYVAVTLKGENPNTVYRRLPSVSLIALNTRIGLSVMRKGESKVVSRATPDTVPDRHRGTRTFVLHMGESRRMLVDLSPMLPQDLAGGEYQLIVSYATGMQTCRSRPVQVALRAPTPPEAQVLARWAPDRSKYDTWTEWTLAEPASADLLTAQVDPSNPLGLNLIMRYLIHGPQRLTEVAPAIFDGLDEFYAGEALALHADLMCARGNRAGLDSLQKRLRREHPSLRWWMDDIVKGTSLLRELRPEP